MLKTISLQKKKALLIALTILVLCGIITLIVLFNIDNIEMPSKAVYVFKLEQ